MTDGTGDRGSVRETAIRHVLREVHADRRTAEVVDSVAVDEGTLFGIKVPPQGFLSQAKYALVVVDDDGRIVRVSACTGGDLRERLADARDGEGQGQDPID